MDPTNYLHLLPAPPGPLLLAGSGLVLLLTLSLLIYNKFRAGKRNDPEPAVVCIPKPRVRNDPKKEEEKERPTNWKKLSGVKTNNDLTEAKKEKSSEQFKKIEPMKEKVSTNTKQQEMKSNEPKSYIQDSSKVNFHKINPPTAVEKNAVKKVPEEIKRVPVKRVVRTEIDEEKEALKFAEELREAERQAEEEAKKHLRPIHLNIDRNARSKDDIQKRSEREMDLVKKLCGEMREIAKTTNPLEREEKQKEIEKVRSAR